MEHVRVEREVVVEKDFALFARGVAVDRVRDLVG